MTRTITARYDGRAIHPDEPLPLPRDTRITLTVHTEAQDENGQGASGGSIPPEADPLAAADIPFPRTYETFAEAVRRIRIDGPPDWSQRVDYYLGQNLSDAAD